MTSSPFRAVALIDRDGTLIEERHYLSNPNDVALLPRAARGLKLLREEGVAVVVCTNQSGVGRGKFTLKDLDEVHARLKELLAAEGASWDGIYYCTADPDSSDPAQKAEMPRRKPSPGMAHEAIAALGLEGLPVYSIGDKLTDIVFGHNAGGAGVLVLTGYGKDTRKQLNNESYPAPIVPDLYDAARWVLNDLVKRAYPNDKMLRRKLMTPCEAHDMVELNRSNGRTVVLANGCFDLLHGGHVSFLENSRAAGDRLVLAVNSNASIGRLKGAGRPILDEASRLQILAGIECVDYLTVFHTDSADEVLEDVRPDMHAKGTDYTSDTVPERITSQRLGIKTIIAGAPKENSTRDIIDVIVERTKAGSL